jgi:tetratricopeptide (TPR) repeat protein
MKPFFFCAQRISGGKYLLLLLFFLSLILPGFFSKTCLADGKRIFENNKNSVVILFSYDREGHQIGHATGFIVRNDGVVLTNYHFVSKAAEIIVKTEDAMLAVKGLLYIDRDNDIAMLKTGGNNLSAIKIRDADTGAAGQKIYMIGSPLGEDKVLFDGTLSRIKDITPERKLLLMTVPVTKGSSGSPVFNETGEVIGIATFFMDGGQPFYFAMPVSQVKSGLLLKKVTPLDKAELIASEDTAEYWINLAAAYESLSLYSYASGAYQNAIRIKPEDAIAHNKLGIVFASLDIYSFAIREHTEAIKLKPDYQEAFYNLGIAYMKSDKIEKAAETFGEAIRLKPDDAKSYNNLAVAFFKSGKLKEAVEATKQAILIKPDYPEAYYNLGAVYTQMNMYSEAIEALKQFIRLKPDIPEVHLRLGIIYSMQDTESALKEYEILKKLDPNGAGVLHKIIETRENISSESRGSSQDTAKEKITQAETMVASPKETSSSGPSSKSLEETLYPPAETATSKEVPLSQKADASVTESILSDKIDGSGNTSYPEATEKDNQIPGKNIYSVQVSVFANGQNALSLIQRLRKKGYNAFLKMEYEVDQNTRYRVLVGWFAEKGEAAKQAQIILNKEKLKSIIFKHRKTD